VANSVGDTVVISTLSKSGYAVMAINAALAGPTFYILIG